MKKEQLVRDSTQSKTQSSFFSKELRHVQTALNVVRSIAQEYETNAEFYHDFAQFNFCNGMPSNKQYVRVCFFDPPPQESRRLRSLYQAFGNATDAEIYRRLGMSPLSSNKHSPIESKWAYTYYKKYGHWAYYERNVVTRAEILRPLTAAESQDYIKVMS